MSDRAESLKLAELRSKTDRQLLALIGHKLDTALVDARRAGYYVDADRLCQEVRELLSLTGSVSPAERSQITSKIRQLGGLSNRRLHGACA